MRSETRLLLLAGCLLVLSSVSTADIVKRVIKTTPPDGEINTHSLTILPINVAAYEGRDVTLICEVADPAASRIHWWEFVTNSNGQMISDGGVILPSHPNAIRYTIERTTPNTFNLIVHDVNLADGGTYVCLDGNSGPPAIYSGQAELVVIGADPNCTSLIPPDGVVRESQNYTESCEIYFGGNLAPTMTWTGPPPFLTTSIPTDGNVWSAASFTIDRSYDTRAFQCHTNFTAPAGVPGGVASNAPEYNHYYQTSQLFVYWGPKNMYAVPMKQQYAVGDLITCYADAFPAPFYQWANMITLEVFSSQIYNVTDMDVGLNTTLRCQAQNLIQGFLFSANLFVNVYVPPIIATTTTPVPTTPPLEANCDNLTGWWLSLEPYAELHLRVPADQTGQVLGFMRNHTDQQWVEVVGRTRLGTYEYVGLTAIWPYEIGVTGMAGECHKCLGKEVIYTGGLWRSSYDSLTCGDGGAPSPNVMYQFNRVSDELYDIHDPSFMVHRPSRHVSGSFGIKHLQYE